MSVLVFRSAAGTLLLFAFQIFRVIAADMAFIQAGQNWQFSTESNLEEVIWHNLPALLNLRPLSRQFSISGKFCDILAVDASNQLVIIELKNTEDRYVVQQLVRYHDAIASAEVLPFDVATSEPRLIAIPLEGFAIAPSARLSDLRWMLESLSETIKEIRRTPEFLQLGSSSKESA